MMRYSKKSLIAFFFITVVFSAVFELLICSGGPEWLYAILMWTPAAAAVAGSIIAIRDRGESFRIRNLMELIGFRRCQLRYILLGCLIPLIYLLVSYGIYWTLHPESCRYYGVSFAVIMKDLCLYTVVMVLVSLMTALGEEIGWRGFMVPALFERIGLVKTLIVSGLIWCCWHFPLLIAGDYMEGTPLWYKLPAFFLCIFPVGVIAGLLALRTRSVWPSAFLHAAHNAYDQTVFGVITTGSDQMYFVSETGIFTILSAWILAVFMYCLMKKKVVQ